MKFLVTLIVYSVELLIILIYSNQIFLYRKNKTQSILISIAVYIFLLIIHTIFPTLEWINIICLCIGNILILFFAFNAKFRSAIFHGILVSVLLYAAEVITVFSISVILNSNTNHYEDNLALYILDTCISKLLYAILMLILAQFLSKKYENKEIGTYWYIVVMPVGSIVWILTTRYLVERTEATSIVTALCLTSSIFLLFGNIITFLIYENAQKNNIRLIEMEMVQQRNKMDKEYLKILEEKNNSLQILAHDIKHHLSTISSIANSEEVDKYISLVNGNVQQYADICKTNNKMLDLIINKYYSVCKENQIDFYVENFSDNFSFMDDSDLSALMNNLLDNAVEAARQCSVKKIELEMHINSNKIHILNIKNSCLAEPKHKGKKLITAKNNKKAHGIGTKSISRTVKKYNGDYEWFYNADKAEFEMIFLFP